MHNQISLSDLTTLAENAARVAIAYYRREAIPEQEYLNTKQAAAYLGFSTQRLEIWRLHGDGPTYIKLAQAVRYKKSELDAFMSAHSRNHTAEGGTK